ncbi:MAG: hypothetical protein JSS43_30345 [Proteobacteria bacterium]|nr:hypothetical protein [Pseudomonadota bacterium]
MMLPDMLDTYLPTLEAKTLLLALVKAHAQSAIPFDVLGTIEPSPLNGEVARALDVAAWLESVPTRMH